MGAKERVARNTQPTSIRFNPPADPRSCAPLFGLTSEAAHTRTPPEAHTFAPWLSSPPASCPRRGGVRFFVGEQEKARFSSCRRAGALPPPFFAARPTPTPRTAHALHPGQDALRHPALTHTHQKKTRTPFSPQHPALVSRQFVDSMSRLRVEGLLAAFPKLVSAGKQHTFVETENVRYLYQPLEVSV